MCTHACVTRAFFSCGEQGRGGEWGGEGRGADNSRAWLQHGGMRSAYPGAGEPELVAAGRKNADDRHAWPEPGRWCDARGGGSIAGQQAEQAERERAWNCHGHRELGRRRFPPSSDRRGSDWSRERPSHRASWSRWSPRRQRSRSPGRGGRDRSRENHRAARDGSRGREVSPRTRTPPRQRGCGRDADVSRLTAADAAPAPMARCVGTGATEPCPQALTRVSLILL